MKRDLITIQKRDKLNRVSSTDEAINGTYHDYEIDCEDVVEKIKFQKGPRKLLDSRHGVLDGDLLEIVRDRLKGFQSGPFASKENEEALMYVEKALMWMNRRVEDRAERKVLGFNEK